MSVARVAVVALSMSVAACGTVSASAPTTTALTATAPTSAQPSESAKMVCAVEAQLDIAQALGEHTSKKVTPTWSDHVYACTYSYPEGMMSLSVKELPDAPSTLTFFGGLATRLGRRTDPLALGNESFVTTGDSVVVRKDNRVLLVDVHTLPGQFGHPPIRRVDAAEVVAETIMKCWTGA